VFSVAQPRITVQSSKAVRQVNPEQDGREPRTTVHQNPEQNDTEPRTVVHRNGSLMVKENGSLNGHALASLAVPPTKKQPRATLERIERGTAYIKAIDHDARLEGISQYDAILGKVRAAHPDKSIDRLSIYVGRPKFHTVSESGEEFAA
jgi:hypothetical protein